MIALKLDIRGVHGSLLKTWYTKVESLLSLCISSLYSCLPAYGGHCVATFCGRCVCGFIKFRYHRPGAWIVGCVSISARELQVYQHGNKAGRSCRLDPGLVVDMDRPSVLLKAWEGALERWYMLNSSRNMSFERASSHMLLTHLSNERSSSRQIIFRCRGLHKAGKMLATDKHQRRW